MKSNIKHSLLALIGLSIGFVLTFEAAAGSTVTVPGNICQARGSDKVTFRSSGAIEGRNGRDGVRARVFCPLAQSSDVEKVDVLIRVDKRNFTEDLVCTLRIQDGEGDRFVTDTNRATVRGPRTFTSNNRTVPADGFFFVECRLGHGDRVEFITVEDD